VLLRSKDVFKVGRVEIKIIFQGRRDAFVPAATAATEVMLASGADKSKSKTRLLDDNGVFTRSLADSDGQITSEELLDKLGVKHRDGHDSSLLIILVMRGQHSRRFFLIDDRGATIGSSPSADISFDGDTKMSPLHARIYFCPEQRRWVLEDLDSEQGTFLLFHGGNITSGDVYLAGASFFRVFGQCSKPKERASGGFLRKFFGGASVV